MPIAEVVHMAATVVFGFALALVAPKAFAYLWGIVHFVRHGGTYREEMKKGQSSLTADAPGAVNPVDRVLRKSVARVPAKHRDAANVLLVVFTTPAVVTIASAAVFAFGRSGDADLRVALASAIGLCVLLALVVAVLRRLVLGEFDAKTSDVRLPRFTRSWAAYRDDGANNTVYFLVLIYLSTIGFAALYDALALDVPRSLANFQPSLTDAIYFSVTTVATVGYGDIHAQSNAAKWIVMAQVSTGPLLLSWLLAVFLTSRANTTPRACGASSEGKALTQTHRQDD
jgi:Ion channel